MAEESLATIEDRVNSIPVRLSSHSCETHVRSGHNRHIKGSK